MKRTVWALLIIFTLTILGNTVYADVKQDFEEGMRLFAEGELQKAIEKFEDVKGQLSGLSEAERRDLSGAFMRSVREELIMRMLTFNHPDGDVSTKIRSFAKYILDNSESGRKEKDRDTQEIRRALLRAIRDPQPVERLNWSNVVVKRYGEFAVPEIHEMFLHCGNTEVMGRAVELLVKIGSQSVMPLIELFKSSIVYDRLHAARALGDIADRRAIPVLVDKFKNDENESVRLECQSALEKLLDMELTEQASASLSDAKEYYYSAALQYYHQLPSLVYGKTDSFVIWRWVMNNPTDPSKGGRLDYDPNIPLWAYMDICAEDLLLSCVRSIVDTQEDPSTDATYGNAWNLLVAINLKQYLEAKTWFDSATTSEDKEALQDIMTRAKRGLVLTGAAGQEVLYKSLERSLIDRLPEISIGILDMLREVGSPEFIVRNADEADKKLGATILTAMQNEDNRVRYSAAALLFTLSPNSEFYMQDMARNVLIQGLGESAQRTINVITEDQDLRNVLRAMLMRLGYYTYFSNSVVDGLKRALSYPSDDLVLLDGKIASKVIRLRRLAQDDLRKGEATASETLIDILKEDFRTADIPVILMYTDEDEKSALERRYSKNMADDQVKGFWNVNNISENMNQKAIEVETDIFSSIWSMESKNVRSKDKANQLAISCAKALMGIDPQKTPHDILLITQALMARVHQERTSTEVKVEMLKVMNHFASIHAPSKINEKFWSYDIVMNMLPVLNSDSVENRPIVKAWVCKTIAQIYLNQVKPIYNAIKAENMKDYWNINLTPGEGRDTAPSMDEPYWVLLNMMQYAPEAGNNLKDASKAQWLEDVMAVRINAGKAMGNAPLTHKQKIYMFENARINKDLKLTRQMKMTETTSNDGEEYGDDDDDDDYDDDDDDDDDDW